MVILRFDMVILNLIITFFDLRTYGDFIKVIFLADV